MATDYYLVFNSKELSEIDFQYLSRSNSDLYQKLLNNKIDLYFNPGGTDLENSGATIKHRMSNWLRKNTNGYWYVQHIDEFSVNGPSEDNVSITNRTVIYIELEEDIVSFKIKWHE